jgi:hypothetical protein
VYWITPANETPFSSFWCHWLASALNNEEQEPKTSTGVAPVSDTGGHVGWHIAERTDGA